MNKWKKLYVSSYRTDGHETNCYMLGGANDPRDDHAEWAGRETGLQGDAGKRRRETSHATAGSGNTAERNVMNEHVTLSLSNCNDATV